MRVHRPLWRRLAADKTSIFVPSHREGKKWDKVGQESAFWLPAVTISVIFVKDQMCNVCMHRLYECIIRVKPYL